MAGFPNKYEDILSLKGIGDYTAAAIASFAFNQPYAVVDGNVFRVFQGFLAFKFLLILQKAKNYLPGACQ